MEILAEIKEDFSVWLCREKKKVFHTFWRIRNRQQGRNCGGCLSLDFPQEKNQSESPWGIKQREAQDSSKLRGFLRVEVGFGPS